MYSTSLFGQHLSALTRCFLTVVLLFILLIFIFRSFISFFYHTSFTIHLHSWPRNLYLPNATFNLYVSSPCRSSLPSAPTPQLPPLSPASPRPPSSLTLPDPRSVLLRPLKQPFLSLLFLFLNGTFSLCHYRWPFTFAPTSYQLPVPYRRINSIYIFDTLQNLTHCTQPGVLCFTSVPSNIFGFGMNEK